MKKRTIFICLFFIYAMTVSTGSATSPAVNLLLLFEKNAYTLNADALIPMDYSDVIAADFDGDGDMDIIQSGYSSGGSMMQYCKNDKGTFVTIQYPLDTNEDGIGDSVLSPLDYEVVFDTVDIDQDGDIDFIGSGGANTYLYENLGNGAFRNRSSWVDTNGDGSGDTILAVASQGCVSFVDYDKDNYPDILLSSASGSGTNSKTTLYHNEQNNTFSIKSNPVDGTAEFPDLWVTAHAWGDFNNDTYPDFIILGGQSDVDITALYENNQNGTFSHVTNPVGGSAAFPGLSFGPVSWGDYDNDTDPDIIISAQGENSDTLLYQNAGNGVFNLISTPLDTNSDGIGDAALSVQAMSECFFIDFDKDSDLDIFMLGWDPDADQECQIFLNNGSGVFSALTNPVDTNSDGAGDAPFLKVGYGGAAFADFDKDGYLDLVYNGHLNDGTKVSKMYKNTGTGLFQPVN